MSQPTTTAAEAAVPRTGPVRVALLLPLSGRAAALGQDMLDAATLAVFDAGPNDLVLMPKDTGDKPGTAAAVAREAISQGAELVLGPLFAASTRAVAPVAAEAGKAVLSFSNDSTALGDGQVFLLGYRPEQQVGRVLGFAASHGAPRLGLLAAEDVYGASAERAFSATMARLQLTGPSASYRSGTSTADAVQGLLGQVPQGLDAVLLADAGARLADVAGRVAASSAPPPRLLGTRRWLDEPAVLTEPAFQGAWVATVEPARLQAFEDRFTAAFNRRPDTLASLAYDATALAVLLAGAEGGFERDSLTDPAGFAGSMGAFRLDRAGTTDHALAIVELRPEGQAVIDPAPTGFTDAALVN